MVRGSDAIVFEREAKLMTILPFALTVAAFVLALIGPRFIHARDNHRAAGPTTSLP